MIMHYHLFVNGIIFLKKLIYIYKA